MKVYVQKFGGTSVATEEARKCVYEKIIRAKNNTENLVVIVSAMGRNGDPYATDTLLDLIRKPNQNPIARELDMVYACGEIISASVIASALNDRGYRAVSLSGQQAGIVTDDNHFDANVMYVNTNKIKKYLEQGIIPVISGSQGVTEDGEITTLGRGGSDISAVVIGKALNAEQVDIYTDVNGVMTADPSKVENTVLLEYIDYESCCVLSERGAKVVHPRAVQLAKQDKNVKLYIKSTFSNCQGTYIADFPSNKSQILSITNQCFDDCDLITVVGVNLNKSTSVGITNLLKQYRISHSKFEYASNYISFAIEKDISEEVVRLLHFEIFANDLLEKLA